MSLQLKSFIDLPENKEKGGFDHAAVDGQTSRLYVAHAVNDALDVIDCDRDIYLHSIPNLTGVAGALVSEEVRLVFTSNRGENTVGIFKREDESSLVKVPVGVRPNGLSFDPQRGLLLAANVGDPNIPNSFTLSIVDVSRQEMIYSIPVPGRTRWAVFDPQNDVFFINISDPPQIVLVNANQPTAILRSIDIPVNGPHGLDIDTENKRLFCACDGQKLVTLQAGTGKVENILDLSGVPDVIFYNPARQHLYVAVGDPGVIDVIHTATMRRLESIPTEKGAHTLGFDSTRNKIYAFLPQTHRAAVFQDSESPV